MTERWEKMAKKAASEWEGPDTQAFAVKLLASQHRAFEQMVRDLMPRTTVGSHNYARKEVLKELLAALAKRKGGGGWTEMQPI